MLGWTDRKFRLDGNRNLNQNSTERFSEAAELHVSVW